jgi:two-component system chemotaxis response regulator CheB
MTMVRSITRQQRARCRACSVAGIAGVGCGRPGSGMLGSVSPAPHWFVAVGASGSRGFQDIDRLLGDLPPLPDATVLLVLHRRTDQVSVLAQVLSRTASMPVVVATDGQRFERGVCYVGEPGEHLALAARSIGKLVADEFRGQHRNRTVDLLFASLAEHAKRRAIGVILSGALDDGSSGLAAIHHSGGLTMVLTPAEQAEVGGMPSNAIRYDGPIDFQGSIVQIAGEIARVVSPTMDRPSVPGHG